MSQRRIAVVGGGIAGLVSAYTQLRSGIEVHLFEASDRVGGVLGTSLVDGYLREHAASSFLGGPIDGALALTELLGVQVEKASRKAKARWIYIDGKLRALPTNPIAFLRSDLLTWRGKLALLREPFVPAGGGTDESVHAFAARRLGPEAARALVAPFVTGVFAADAHDISLEAGFPRLAALDAAGGLVRGGLRQMLGGIRRRGKPETAGGKTPRGMYAPVGGMAAIIDALARELGPRVHTGAAIRTIEPIADGVSIAGERWDRAVLALPAAAAIPLVASTVPELATKLAGLSRAPIALVYLGVDEASLPPDALAAFGLLVAKGEALRVLGIVFESTVWAGRAPAGRVLLRCVYGGSRDPSAPSLGDAELIDQACRDVARALELPAALEPDHASVVRCDHAIAQYAVGHADRVREATAVARTARLGLVGADYHGAGLNDICRDAFCT
ncbi:MAG TPA: protoporphyrinogen oxidase [Kofleriaceae bacterium]|jgi:oxygen-dependent protoporphyrinogen oxidase